MNNFQQQQLPASSIPTSAHVLPTAATAATTAPAPPRYQYQHQYRLCIRCHHPNPDVLLPSCRCTLHARCCPVPIRCCPDPLHSSLPLNPGCPLELLPMDFGELDEAKRAGGGAKRRVKKKARLDGPESEEEEPASPSAELRTGRWTPEETAHCDGLIRQFMSGRLPLSEGLKLNEFLANMLRSKQSRLTKKMKNAKLSSKTFKRTIGFLGDDLEARAFGDAESAFFGSIQDPLERAEMRFHISKEWRESFSTYCVSHGQSLNADDWLASVEEMERRNLRAKEAERARRREMMMGCALRQDAMNPDRGVSIERARGGDAGGVGSSAEARDPLEGASAASVAAPSFLGDGSTRSSASPERLSSAETPSEPPQGAASPFLHRIVSFVHRHHVPFEYVDAWVPSFVPDSETLESDQPKCRLCFAGYAVAKQTILETAQGTRRAAPLSSEEAFNLSSFGDYSESFSFDVGCGLPGRVYHMGVPTWEQSVHNAPLHHFERVGGAQQWGIRTVVGIPVPSPNVGRVVVVLYSRYDRPKDHDLVIRLTEEFTRLMPSPKWKLVVDVGESPVVSQQQQQPKENDPPQNASTTSSDGNDSATLTSEVISIFGEHMPSDPSNPGFSYLQGFMSLRLLLLRTARTPREQDAVDTILSSYSSYKAGGRTRPDMALMLARDFMFLNQQNQVPAQLPQCAPTGGRDGQPSYLGSGAPSMPNGPYHSYRANGAAPTAAEVATRAHCAPHPPRREDEYFANADDVEPSPFNRGRSAPPSPLTLAVENVESLMSPDNAGSNA